MSAEHAVVGWSAVSPLVGDEAEEPGLDACRTAHVVLDDFGVVLEHSIPRGWFVRGWAARRDPLSPISVQVVLRGSEQSFVAPTYRRDRPDVAQAFGDPELVRAGFVGSVPVEPIADGDFELLLRVGGELLATGRWLRVQGGMVAQPLPNAGDLIHVAHVPKTAGTSFRELLERAFPNRVTQLYQRRAVLLSDTKVVQGHSYATTFTQIFPEIRLAMWFRDPVERMASEYGHWMRHPPDSEAKEVFAQAPTDLASFSARRDQVNVHRRVLNGLPLERINFVGITEYFEESIELFTKMFEIALDPSHAANVNPEKDVGKRYDLAPEVRAEIAARNAADIALYQRAKERFFALCAAYDVRMRGERACLGGELRESRPSV